mmetsp:Transcript_153607/g.283157  ORF Transcript_153607/g.283157 Transcript_153607/m.283157 type:complete len:171 (+) Transcript_153607:1-513(+)
MPEDDPFHLAKGKSDAKGASEATVRGSSKDSAQSKAGSQRGDVAALRAGDSPGGASETPAEGGSAERASSADPDRQAELDRLTDLVKRQSERIASVREEHAREIQNLRLRHQALINCIDAANFRTQRSRASKIGLAERSRNSAPRSSRNGGRLSSSGPAAAWADDAYDEF